MMRNKYLKKTFYADTCRGKIKVFLAGNGIRLDNGHQRSSEKASRGVHYHFTYEIFFVGDDELEITALSGKETYAMKAVIISPKIRHYTVSCGNDCFCLLFSADDVDVNIYDGIEAFSVSPECMHYIRRAAECYEDNDEKSVKDTELFISLAFNEIIDKVVCTQKENPTRKKTAKHISTIERYINANIFAKVTLADVSKHIFLSTRQIERIIKEEYGCGLLQLVNSKKMDAAEMLIKNTDIKISEIARQVSIGSENYFYSLFKQKYGMTPLQYRKSKAREHRKSGEEV